MSFEDVTEIVSLCGGGIAAVTYAQGILYALHKTNRIIKNGSDGKPELNKEIVYTASSGGMLPLIVLQGVINNELYKVREDWFEHYVIETISRISSSDMIQLYIAIIAKSFGIYNNSFPEIVRANNQKIGELILDTLPSEIINGKQYIFTKDKLSYFNYNYVIDSAFNSSPMVSNDFTHLNNFPVHIQIAEAATACCIAVTFSHLQNGILNDAALLVDNDILGLDNYTNLKRIYYYSLTAYDEITNNHYREHVFSLKNLEDRSSRIFNYRAINNLKLYCSRKNLRIERDPIEFKLIVVPNKYNPLRKYNNKIYNDVVPSMFFQCDFIEITRFIGFYSGDLRMNQFMFLLGAYETLHARGEKSEVADHITDALKPIYKETLDNAYNVYFKTDLISVIMRSIAASI